MRHNVDKLDACDHKDPLTIDSFEDSKRPVPKVNAPKKPIEVLTVQAGERIEQAMDLVWTS